MPTKQYLIVDNRKCRRNSAPEYLGTRNALGRHHRLRPTVSDLSVLLDNQSESGSSLELDTSNISPELSPVLTLKSSRSSSGSYQSLPVIHFEVYRTSTDEYSFWSPLCSWFLWKTFFLSQAMGVCLTIMTLCNGIITSYGENVIGQCFVSYVFFAFIWTTRLAIRSTGRSMSTVVKLSGLRYLLLSVLHVEANYFLFSAFKLDSYFGNQTIDTVAATLSIVLAYVCLEVQFQVSHVSGFAISILGSMGLCAANSTSMTGEDEISWGDILRIGSGIFLALNNLAQELIVKSIDSVEYMGMIGLLGTLISALQITLLEAGSPPYGNVSYWLSIACFSLVQFTFNCLTPRLLRDIGTTGLHLSLISSEFYTYCIMCILTEQKNLLYFFSYAFVLLGLYTFILKKASMGTQNFFPIKVVIPE